VAIRNQAGQIIERSGAFYVRYYTADRKRVTYRLCVKDAKHHDVSSKAVKFLRDKHMLKINSEAGASSRTNPRDVIVKEFWSDTYLPWAKSNLRFSTVDGYEKTWKLYLEDRLGKRNLREYKTHEGSQLLTDLVPKLGATTLQHVRSLASGIFTHAVNLGLIDRNPWAEVKILAKVRASQPTKHYTLEEAEDTIRALASRIDAQAVFALAFFLGLRPSEIAGLQWEDVDEEFVHIRRAAVKGHVGETKTQESVASLPLIQPVKGLLSMWREKCKKASKGWIFRNAKGGPLNVESFCRNVLIPILGKAQVAWKSLYAARRGCATMLTGLTGNPIAARAVLRHKSMLTLLGHYDKANLEAADAGLKLFEQKSTVRALSGH
jgi:integrase